jgi:hypothetical protein
MEGTPLASYLLASKVDYQDRSNNEAELAWRGLPVAAFEDIGAFLGPGHWLETTAPVASVTERIAETSQFTLSATLAAANSEQHGPARIISISGDAFHRNFTLGQDKTDLILRLRTPLTGENGASPELAVPDVFVDSSLHHLVITYQPPVIRLYIDNVERVHSFDLTPQVTFFQYLLPVDGWRIRLNTPYSSIYTVLFYMITLVPLATLLAEIFTRLKRNER